MIEQPLSHRLPFSLVGDRAATQPALGQHDWVMLSILLTGAALARLAFFNGPFGSDDLVYLQRAVEISQGVWSSANYIGALRYGFNIPAGFFIWLFGVNTLAANLWPLLCSLAEITVVYLFAARVWGRQAAVYSALILLSMPLHIAVATRIHADPIVCFFLTLSFALFFIAEQRRSSLLYFVTGMAMGLVFWAKEVVVITLLAFMLYPLLVRKLDSRWLYVVWGGLTMLLAHFILMTLIAGDPLHVFKVALGQIDRNFIQAGQGEDQAGYYFWYLFVDIKHTWLAPFLATAVVLAVVLRRPALLTAASGVAYVAFWLVALLAVLSFVPISLDPVRLVMKQSNYLSLFLAPIALLAGYLLAQLRRKMALTLLTAVVTGGLLLGALEQQAYHVFTSNSKAAVEFARAHPQDWLVGSVNNANIAGVYAILDHEPGLEKRFNYLSKEPPAGGQQVASGGSPPTGYAVLDRETMNWGQKALPLASPPPCWRETTRLVPTGFGLGHRLVQSMLTVVEALPGALGRSLVGTLRQLSQPQPASVYRVDHDNLWCDRPEPDVVL